MPEYARFFQVPIGLFTTASLIAVLSLAFSFPRHALSQAAGTPITGYAWADNIGWISFNCSNTSSCGASNYGLTIAADGTVSGYAWSDNVGWISANSTDVSGCPSAPCTPAVTISTGAMSGWLRAQSYGGGWDGWISLSGSGYGPVLASGGIFSGYAWGSDVVGWTDFSYAQTTYKPCTPNTNVCLNGTTLRHYNTDCTYSDATCQFASYGYGCSGNACLVPPSPGANSSIPGGITAKPHIVHSGNTVQVSWSVDNASSTTCTVTGNNGDLWVGLASSTKTSSAITQQTIYKLHCNGSAVSILTYDAQTTVNIAPTFRER